MIVFGPLEENAAMNGAGFVPSTAFGEVIYPFGSLSVIIYICIYIKPESSKHIRYIMKEDLVTLWN